MGTKVPGMPAERAQGAETEPVDPANLRKFDRNLLAAGNRLAPRVLEEVPFCWFCDVRSGRRSKEHIFPRWMLDHFGAADEMVHPTRMTAFGELASERPARPLRAHVNGEVCAGCNNGWMSSLETAAKGILTRRPLRQRIPSDEAEVLARWFIKTAVNLNVSQPFRLLVDAPARHALATRIPDRFAVYLFRVRRQNGVVDWVQKGVDSGLVPSEMAGEFTRLTQLTLVTHIRVADVVGVVTYVPDAVRTLGVTVDGAALIHPRPQRLPTWGGLPRHNNYLAPRARWDLATHS
jgi:hypothetical protein